uniref:Uncharacterized protein n=1 Tax=Isometrus maculatus TaxID=497827 RepID=A0A0U1TZE0_ISOMC|nr:hypothetical protein [Isometrus maculatus]
MRSMKNVFVLLSILMLFSTVTATGLKFKIGLKFSSNDLCTEDDLHFCKQICKEKKSELSSCEIVENNLKCGCHSANKPGPKS